MRTNIDIDDEVMAAAMKAGPFTTKKDAVEAGLRLLARQAAYREILKWEGRLQWQGDEDVDWTRPPPEPAGPREALAVNAPDTLERLAPKPAATRTGGRRARR